MILVILVILRILDFCFWGFGILDFGDGAWRSEGRIPPGPPLGATSKPTVSDRVGAKKQTELQKPGAQEATTTFYTFLHGF